MDDTRPDWCTLGEELLYPLIGISAVIARGSSLPGDLRPLPELALLHHAACIGASIDANKEGKHSAAMCLIRQSVEALTVAEIGLQPPDFAAPLLASWSEGRRSHGELRRALEREVWPSYGRGLWDEPWADFARNLARAVQPYAHYTRELQGWQFVHLGGSEDSLGFVKYGPQTYDALKASRITLLHSLLTWVLGRVLMAHGDSPDVEERSATILLLGRALSQSKLLFEGGEWWAQLSPHMWFKPGHDWRDDT